MEFKIEKLYGELSRKKTFDSRVAWILEELYRKGEIEDETETTEVLSFADIKGFFKGGKHGLITGKTGGGKTNLQIWIERELLKRDFKVIHRDDGGEGFIYNMPYTETIIWCPKVEGLHYKIYFPDGMNPEYQIKTFDPRRPEKMMREIYRSSEPYHIILYHMFDTSRERECIFLSEFLKQLIHHVKRLPTWKKEKMFFSSDQLNDVLSPKMVSPSVREAIADFEFCLRNLRKHMVSILVTTHRFMEITKSARFNFSYYFIKRMKISEVYEWLNRELIAISTRLFVKVAWNIPRLREDQLLFFDEEGFFDVRTNPCIEEFRYERDLVRGEIEDVRKKTFDKADILIALLRSQGYKWTDICNYVGMPFSTAHLRLERLLEDEKIGPILEKIGVTIRPKRKKKKTAKNIISP
jgi:hypothetical protein